MSTRSAITVPQEGRFIGVYHHWDGYPSGLGTTLVQLAHHTFGGDLALMAKTLIDTHPAGWSTLNRGGDRPWTQEEISRAGFAERTYQQGEPEPDHPQCYCHGVRSEEENPITCLGPACDGKTCDPVFIEWLYVIQAGGLDVWASRPTGRQETVTGRNGSYETSEYRHVQVGRLDWALATAVPALLANEAEVLEGAR